MRLAFTRRAERDHRSLSLQLRDRLDRQLAALLNDLRHPSLHAKKYDEARDIWQGRVTRDYRFYFTIRGDTYIVLSITKHPK